MEKYAMKYEFSAKPYQYEWVFVSLPKKLSIEIRHNFKMLEEG